MVSGGGVNGSASAATRTDAQPGRRPRVAMVAYTLFEPDARVRRHVDALVQAGYAVDVFALAASTPARAGAGAGARGPAERPHVRFFLPRERRYGNEGKIRILCEYLLFAGACCFLMLERHRRDGRYALIHVNNMPNFLVFAALPLRWLKTPVLLDIHDTMVEIYQDRFGVGEGHPVIRLLRLEERLSMRAAHFVLTSEHTKWARLRENGLAADRSAVVLNLPDTALFPETPLPAELPPDEPPRAAERFRLVYHGTLAHRLGVDLAVAAVHRLGDRIPNLRFDIIGDGEQRSHLVARITELNLADRIFLSDGFVPTDRLAEMLAGADLAVLPSRDRVGTRLMLPTKLLEYVRLGIPAVTVPTPTIRHYFTAEQVAFVPSEDPAALAERILELWQHPAERARLARAAREFTTRYGFHSERKRYLEIVDRLVSG